MSNPKSTKEEFVEPDDKLARDVNKIQAKLLEEDRKELLRQILFVERVRALNYSRRICSKSQRRADMDVERR
jgi:hypothetical protein